MAFIEADPLTVPINLLLFKKKKTKQNYSNGLLGYMSDWWAIITTDFLPSQSLINFIWFPGQVVNMTACRKYYLQAEAMMHKQKKENKCKKWRYNQEIQ